MDGCLYLYTETDLLPDARNEFRKLIDAEKLCKLIELAKFAALD